MPHPSFELSLADFRQHSFQHGSAVFVVAIACGIVCGFGFLLRTSRDVATIHPVPATGRVMWGGKPRTNWRVVFVYDEFDMQGGMAIEVTGVDGRFTLSTPYESAFGRQRVN